MKATEYRVIIITADTFAMNTMMAEERMVVTYEAKVNPAYYVDMSETGQNKTC